jgi:RNA polymerase sigma-70 factor (ECF subfamily)
MLLEGPARAASWARTAILVEQAQAGDRDAFGLLFEQFEGTVFAIAKARLGNPSEADELTQDVFVHAFLRLDQLRDPERFAGWLRQMTVRMAINRATRRVPPSPMDDDILAGLGAERDDPSETLIRDERAARLWTGLERLKPLDRETLVLFYIRELSLNEMAAELDVPLGTIKRRLHTARGRLKTILQELAPGSDDEWVDAPEAEDDEAGAVDAIFALDGPDALS